MNIEAHIRECIATPPRPLLPDSIVRLGSVEATWEEIEPGVVRISSVGGTIDDRNFVDKYVWIQLSAAGYSRDEIPMDVDPDEPLDPEHARLAGFTVESTWNDIMAKSKRLLQSGQVTMLRNGYNDIMAHVIGDHGEYNTELSREDPNSRVITQWRCECPWSQYAFGRTRKWKKYEGRVCSHALAAYWNSLATPLDDHNPEEHGPLDPGQKAQDPNAPAEAGPAGFDGSAGPPIDGAPAPDTGIEEYAPAPGGLPNAAQSPLAPVPAVDKNVLPQFAPPEPLPPYMPGSAPVGTQAPPNAISVPDARQPGPANPLQNRNTLSKVAAQEYKQGDVVKLKVETYGTAEGVSEAHGSGSFRMVPKNTTGEVVHQDPTTQWIECMFPCHNSGELEPYHVRVHCEPSEIQLMPGARTPFQRYKF